MDSNHQELSYSIKFKKISTFIISLSTSIAPDLYVILLSYLGCYPLSYDIYTIYNYITVHTLSTLHVLLLPLLFYSSLLITSQPRTRCRQPSRRRLFLFCWVILYFKTLTNRWLYLLLPELFIYRFVIYLLKLLPTIWISPTFLFFMSILKPCSPKRVFYSSIDRLGRIDHSSTASILNLFRQYIKLYKNKNDDILLYNYYMEMASYLGYYDEINIIYSKLIQTKSKLPLRKQVSSESFFSWIDTNDISILQLYS